MSNFTTSACTSCGHPSHVGPCPCLVLYTQHGSAPRNGICRCGHQTVTQHHTDPHQERIATLEREVAELRRDKARLDQIEIFLEGGVLDAGVEMDGGIYLALGKLGKPNQIVLRNSSTFRIAWDAAIDQARE